MSFLKSREEYLKNQITQSSTFQKIVRYPVPSPIFDFHSQSDNTLGNFWQQLFDAYMSIRVNFAIAVILAFLVSFVLAPTSRGVIYFFVFVYVSELFRFCTSYGSALTSRTEFYYYATTRLALVLASVLGWYFGKLVLRENDPCQQAYDWFEYYFSYPKDENEE